MDQFSLLCIILSDFMVKLRLVSSSSLLQMQAASIISHTLIGRNCRNFFPIRCVVTRHFLPVQSLAKPDLASRYLVVPPSHAHPPSHSLSVSLLCLVPSPSSFLCTHCLEAVKDFFFSPRLRLYISFFSTPFSQLLYNRRIHRRTSLLFNHAPLLPPHHKIRASVP